MNPNQTAAAVLAKAACFDPTMPKPDPVILAAWAEALDGCDQTRALAAVTEHYRSESKRIMPADVLMLVRRSYSQDASLYAQPADFNAIPDADPDDVPAWLEAKRAGRLVNNSPSAYEQRPVRELIAQTIREASA